VCEGGDGVVNNAGSGTSAAENTGSGGNGGPDGNGGDGGSGLIRVRYRFQA
jgi:hypothetical protein